MILWLNPVSGLSGDMLLGALLDLGAPVEAVRAAVGSTGIRGWDLAVEDVRRSGIRARHARVTVEDAVAERRATELMAMAAAASPGAVARTAAAAITALAEAEAAIHGVPVGDVHLHELGGVDTVVDTVGVAAAAHALGVTQVWSAPVALGTGVVHSAHGLLPVPAPATLALLGEAQVIGSRVAGETVTPTGAALLRALACQYGPPPAMTIRARGYGAGTRDHPEGANVLPAVLGEAVGPHPDAQLLTVIETTVDDVTGEVLGAVIDYLLADGALDAWAAPVVGKKGRPAHVITALCAPDVAGVIEQRLLRETGSLGARHHSVVRHALARQFAEVQVCGHPVRIKIGPHRSKPEHDDILAVARATGLPVRSVAEQALAEHSRSHRGQAAPRARRGR
jgi:pyridinium-3,5-bisthiocarboxylic acid mononucleotide nickel chelatase